MTKATGKPFEPGRLLLVHYPFTDATGGKIRPVLVVSRSEFNQGEDFIVVPISSQVTNGERFGYKILDDEECFAATKLKYSSTVKWTKPMTISKTVVVRTLGILAPKQMSEIVDLLNSLF